MIFFHPSFHDEARTTRRVAHRNPLILLCFLIIPRSDRSAEHASFRARRRPRDPMPRGHVHASRCLYSSFFLFSRRSGRISVFFVVLHVVVVVLVLFLSFSLRRVPGKHVHSGCRYPTVGNNSLACSMRFSYGRDRRNSIASRIS